MEDTEHELLDEEMGDGESEVLALEEESITDNGDKERCRSHYASILDSFPFGWQDEAGVLWGIVESVCFISGAESSSTGQQLVSEFVDSTGSVSSLAALGSHTIFRGLITESEPDLAFPGDRPAFCLPDDNQRRSIVQQLTQVSAKPKTTLSTLKTFQNHARCRRQILRLLSFREFFTRPVMSAVERGIKESELMTFTKLSPEELYRCDQLRIFSDMIAAETKPLPNFTGQALSSSPTEVIDIESIKCRRFQRAVPALSFSSILSEEEAAEPLTLTHYYEMTDQVLVALHWPPPVRRNERSCWAYNCKEPTSVALATLVKDFKVETTTVTPAGRALIKVCSIHSPPPLPVEKPARGKKKTKAAQLPPEPLPAPPPYLNPWFTAVLDNAMLGVRLSKSVSAPSAAPSDDERACNFFFLNSDNVKFSFYPGPLPTPLKKPDRKGTVCALVSLPNGMGVTVCSNGNIKISSNSQAMLDDTHLGRANAHPLFLESHRVVGPNLTVMRVLDGSLSGHPFTQELCYLDGSRDLHVDRSRLKSFAKKLKRHPSWASLLEISLLEKMPADATSIRLTADGEVLFFNEDQPCAVNEPQHSLLQRQTDATSHAHVDSYDDGRLVVCHASGRREVVFPDGTSFVHDPELKIAQLTRAHLRSAQVCESKEAHGATGWPEIEMDLDVDSTCRSHALGKEVPINKGGQRVRTRVCLADGTAIFIKYDTRVTAATNGSLKIVTRDRHCVHAADDCVVQFLPSTAWTSEAERLFQEDCALDGVAALSAQSASTILEGALATAASLSRSVLGSSLSSDAATATRSAKRSSAVPSRRSRRAGQTSPSPTRSVEGPTVQSALPPPEVDPTFTVELLTSGIRVQDYEFNTFSMNLACARCDPPTVAPVGELPDQPAEGAPSNGPADPLAVKVELAGEVPGLKPPAVARNPRAPRLFIVNRDGQSVELLSREVVARQEHLARWNPDCIKVANEGARRQLHYFVRRRILGTYTDGLDFSSICGARLYASLDCPAASALMVRTRPLINFPYRVEEVPLPRFFESFSVLESAALQDVDYSHVAEAIRRCEAFRQQRLQSIDRFAVEDPRGSDELEEEEAIVKRLKLAYKAAKVNAAKRKEQRAKEQQEEKEEAEDDFREDKGFKPTKLSGAIAEEQGDEDEGGDEDGEHFSDDEDAPVEPEEVEVRATFEDYVVETGAAEGWASTPMMPLDSLQEALIRIFNKFISQEIIEKAAVESGEIEMAMEEITLHEFRGIYRCVKALLHLDDQPDLDAAEQVSTSGDTVSSMGSHLSASRMKHGEDWPSPDAPPSRTATTSKIAPMLNLSRLQFDDEDKDCASDVGGAAPNQSAAVGAGMNVVRKKGRAN